MKGMQYRFGPFRLVSSTRQIWREGQPIELPRRVFDCLLYLLENRDRAVGRDELVAAVWGRVDVADTQLSQLVRRLRRLLGDDGQVQQTVRTVQGFGYRWALPVEAAPFVPAPSAENGAPVAARAPLVE
jgi:DNA-binding winged helix-turn-helix (wHTH) protein